MMKNLWRQIRRLKIFLGRPAVNGNKVPARHLSSEKDWCCFWIGIVLSNTARCIQGIHQTIKVEWHHIWETESKSSTGYILMTSSGFYCRPWKMKNSRCSTEMQWRPQPVSNKELVLAMARSGKRFISVKVPSFVLKWMLG